MSTATEVRRTTDEIERLKRDWLDDPCWDIEDTEGFEAHHDELLIFHLRKQLEWEKERQKAADRMGLSPSGYGQVMSLVLRVQRLEQVVESLYDCKVVDPPRGES